MPQEDHRACELNHPEEILWVVFPANDDATIIMKPSKQTLDFPATTIASQRAAVLCDWFAPVPAVRPRSVPHGDVGVPADPMDRCRTLCRRSSAPVFHGGTAAGAWVRRGWLHSAKR